MLGLDRHSLSRPIVVIALLQVVAVFVGFFSVAIMLKMSGWPDSVDPTMQWNPWAVLLRRYGCLLLGIPVGWTVYALAAKRFDDRWLDFRVALLLGGAVAIGLLLFFVLIGMHPYHRALLIHTGG